MSVNSKMTAIANAARALDGSTAALTLDGIASKLGVEKTNIAAALAAIAEKGVEVPSGSTSDALASLIASIEAGGGGLAATCGVHVSATDSEKITIEHGLSKRPALILWFAYPTGEQPAVYKHKYFAVQSYLFGGFAFSKYTATESDIYFTASSQTAEEVQTKWNKTSGYSSDLFYNVNENTFSTKMHTVAGLSCVWIAFENDLVGVAE